MGPGPVSPPIAMDALWTVPKPLTALAGPGKFDALAHAAAVMTFADLLNSSVFPVAEGKEPPDFIALVPVVAPIFAKSLTAVDKSEVSLKTVDKDKIANNSRQNR